MKARIPKHLSPPKEWSQSALARFADCPGAYARSVIVEEEGKTAQPLVVGRALHHLTAMYDVRCMVDRTDHLDREAMEDIFRAGMKEQPEAAEYTDECLELFDEYWGFAMPDYARLLHVEYSFGGADNIKTPKGRLLRGRWDRIYARDNTEDGHKHIGVRDHKTDHRIVAHGDVPKEWQLRFYAYAATKRFKVAAVTAGYQYIRHGSIHRAYTFEPKDLEVIGLEIDTRIDAVEAAFESRRFPYQIGDRCSICPHGHTCPALDAALTSAPDTTAAVKDLPHAHGLALILVALEEKRKRLIAALKPWCNEFGPVFPADMRVGFTQQKVTSWPDKETEETLLSHNHELGEVQKWDGEAIKRLMKKDADLADALEDVAVRGFKTVFKVQKQKGDKDNG